MRTRVEGLAACLPASMHACVLLQLLPIPLPRQHHRI